MTIAEEISAEFQDSGGVWETSGGESIDAVCSDSMERRVVGPESTKYTFIDGSCLVLGAEMWDFGWSDCDCHCFSGLGEHTEDCHGTYAAD